MRQSESGHHRFGRRPSLLILATAALLLLAAVALAQSAYDLSWHTISGGGGRSSGGFLMLEGGVVQPAGVMQGGKYQVAGGFWSFGAAAAPTFPQLWLPVLLKRMAWQ